MLINKTIYQLSDYVENFRLNATSCWIQTSDYDGHELLFVDSNLDDKVSQRGEIRDSIFDKIVENESKTIEDGAKLYFEPSSKFPRFKLEDKPYKRVIKQKSADYTVIKTIKRSTEIALGNFSRYYLWEFDDAIYIAPVTFINYASNINEFLVMYNGRFRDQFRENIEADEERRNLSASYESQNRELPETYRTIYLFDFEKNKIWSDIYTGAFTGKYIFDSTLDAIVSKTNPKLDEVSVDQIVCLLKSSDSESQVLGLKMLSLSDYMSEPHLAKFLLYKTAPNWSSNKKTKGTAIDTMIKNLNIAVEQYGILTRRHYWWTRGFYDMYTKTYNDYLNVSTRYNSVPLSEDQWNFMLKIAKKYGFE